MSKYAKTTLLTLSAFLVLGFPITANAKPDNAPPAFDVNVVNTPLEVNVVDVQSAAVEQVSIFVSMLDKTCAGGGVIYTVPEGYRLKIVDAYARANNAANTNAIIADAGVSLSINSYANGTAWKLIVAYSNEIPLGGGRVTEVYADQLEEVTGRVEGCTNDLNATFNVVGHLIPIGE
jgi:hypothetical protein